MRYTFTATALFTLLLSGAPALGQALDCDVLLRGTHARLGADHQPSPMTPAQKRAAMSGRVCVQTFVQVAALRPILEAKPDLARLLNRFDSAEGDQVDAAIHDLFDAVQQLPSKELGAIADLLRRGGPALGGSDPLQAELFARYLQVRRLYEEGDYPAIARVVEELRSNTRAGSLVDTGRIDVADVATYFRAETLWSALNAFELEALSLIPPRGEPRIVSYIARRLDLPESSLALLPSPELQNLLDAAFSALANLAGDVDMPAIRRLSGVAGTSDTDEHLDIYLRS